MAALCDSLCLYAIGVVGSLAMSNAHAAQIPSALLGKSLTLTWSESWNAHDALSDTVKHFPVSSNVKVYISTHRRIFSSLERVAGNRSQVDKTFEQVSSEGKGLLHWHYQEDGLVADQPLAQGDRRIDVQFSNNFSDCKLKILIAKLAGTNQIHAHSISRLYEFDEVQITVKLTSCQVSDGNILAN